MKMERQSWVFVYSRVLCKSARGAVIVQEGLFTAVDLALPMQRLRRKGSEPLGGEPITTIPG